MQALFDRLNVICRDHLKACPVHQQQQPRKGEQRPAKAVRGSYAKEGLVGILFSFHEPQATFQNTYCLLFSNTHDLFRLCSPPRRWSSTMSSSSICPPSCLFFAMYNIAVKMRRHASVILQVAVSCASIIICLDIHISIYIFIFLRLKLDMLSISL